MCSTYFRMYTQISKYARSVMASASKITRPFANICILTFVTTIWPPCTGSCGQITVGKPITSRATCIAALGYVTVVGTVVRNTCLSDEAGVFGLRTFSWMGVLVLLAMYICLTMGSRS